MRTDTDLNGRPKRNGPEKIPTIKAVFAVRKVPIELFGIGNSAALRKAVLLAIASWADPDGTNACPGLKTLANVFGISVRGLSKVIRWLKDHQLLTVASKAGRPEKNIVGTNNYTLTISEEDQAECRTKLLQDPEHQRLAAKRERTRDSRSQAAKARWASRKTNAQKCSPGQHVEHSDPGEDADPLNVVFHDDVEQCASDIEHPAHDLERDASGHGTLGSNNRLLDRQIDRPTIPSAIPTAIKQHRDGAELSLFQQPGNDSPGSSPGSGQTQHKAFLVDLAVITDGDVVFNHVQQQAILNLLQGYSQEEIKAAFKEFYGRIAGDPYELKFGAKNFCEKAEILLDMARRRQAEKERTIALVEQTAARVKSESEKANAVRAAREAEEEALVEEDPFS